RCYRLPFLLGHFSSLTSTRSLASSVDLDDSPRNSLKVCPNQQSLSVYPFLCSRRSAGLVDCEGLLWALEFGGEQCVLAQDGFADENPVVVAVDRVACYGVVCGCDDPEASLVVL